MVALSPVDLAKHNVARADERDDVGDHVALRDGIEGGQVREARRADLAAVRPVGAVRHEVDAELALGRLDRSVGLALRDSVALGEELSRIQASRCADAGSVSTGDSRAPAARGAAQRTLKWWMRASMDSFISARGGGTILWSSTLTAPGGICGGWCHPAREGQGWR